MSGTTISAERLPRRGADLFRARMDGRTILVAPREGGLVAAETGPGDTLWRVRPGEPSDAGTRWAIEAAGALIGSLERRHRVEVARLRWAVHGPDGAEIVWSRDLSAAAAVAGRLSRALLPAGADPATMEAALLSGQLVVGGLRVWRGRTPGAELHLRPGAGLDPRLGLALAVGVQALRPARGRPPRAG